MFISVRKKEDVRSLNLLEHCNEKLAKRPHNRLSCLLCGLLFQYQMEPHLQLFRDVRSYASFQKSYEFCTSLTICDIVLLLI